MADESPMMQSTISCFLPDIRSETIRILPFFRTLKRTLTHRDSCVNCSINVQSIELLFLGCHLLVPMYEPHIHSCMSAYPKEHLQIFLLTYD